MGEFTDSSFVRRLESLFLLARKVLGGSLQADRKSRKKGSGILFADYKEYDFGDDYRSIDWRVYARFDELVVKMFELEEDATIYILLDTSRSMGTKFHRAKELAAALGYIALNSLDRLAVYGVGKQLKTIVEPCRGHGKVFPFLEALESCEAKQEDSDLAASARTFQARHRGKGLVILISDFLFPGGAEDGVSVLQWRKHDLFCLQLHDPEDLTCDLKGDVELECVETNSRTKVTVGPREAKAYMEAIREWNENVRDLCARRGVPLATTTSDQPFDKVIRGILQRGGLVG